jgi:hypothetical protein
MNQQKGNCSPGLRHLKGGQEAKENWRLDFKPSEEGG